MIIIKAPYKSKQLFVAKLQIKYVLEVYQKQKPELCFGKAEQWWDLFLSLTMSIGPQHADLTNEKQISQHVQTD